MIVHYSVHGGWTSWTTWSECQILCKGAWRTRYRSCTNPVPLYTGDTCPGAEDDYQPCEYKFMKRGTPYIEERINHQSKDMGEVLSKSISKIECILKCQIRADCSQSGFIAHKDKSGQGTCYVIQPDNNKGLDNRYGNGEDIVDDGFTTFSVVRPAPPGNDENIDFRGFC